MPKTPLAACFILLSALAAAGDDWPVAFHDALHSGRTSEVLLPPLTLAWTWKDTIAYDNDPKWNRQPYPWLPIFSQGRLYIQGGMNANRLFALDPATGSTLWESDNPGYTSAGTYLFQFANYPAAVNGRILSASTDFTASVDAATGGDQHAIYNTNGGWPSGGATLWNGRAIFQFVETDDGSEDLHPVSDPVKLVEDCGYSRPDRSFTFSDFAFRVPAVDNGVVYANRLGQLLAWDPAACMDVWTWGSRNYGASPALWKHTLFFYASSRGVLIAIPTGAMAATSFSLGGVPILWTAAIPGAYAPIASEGTVYTGSSDRNFYALDAQTGVVKWKFATGAAFTPLQIPAISRNLVFVPGADRILYALNKDTGQEVWRYTGTAPFGPVVIGGGRLVVSDTAFTLYGFTAAGAAVGPSIAAISSTRVSNGSASAIGLTGAGFTGATAVQLEDAPHTPLTGFTVTSDASIAHAIVHAGLAPGRYRVSVVTPVGASADGPEIEVLPDGSLFRGFVGISQGPYEHGTDLPFQRHLVRLSDGVLIAAYSGRRADDGLGGTLLMNYSISRDGGKTWSPPMNLDPGQEGYKWWAATFGIAAGPDNQIHVVFKQWPGYKQTFVAYRYDGSDFLSAPKTPANISADPVFPGASITDVSGRIWVAYVLGIDVYAAWSSDGGVTWTQTAKISQGSGSTPAIALFSGAPLVVFSDNGKLVSSMWNGTQWSAPLSLPGPISIVNDNLSMVTTADGRVHLTAAGSAGLRYLNFDGAAWSQETALDIGGAMPSLTTNGTDLWCFYATASKNIAYRRWRAVVGAWDPPVPVTSDALGNSRPSALAFSPDNTVPLIWTVGDAPPYEIHSAVISAQSAGAALEARLFAAPRMVSGRQGALVVSTLGGQPPYNVTWSPAPEGSTLSGANVTFTRAGSFRFSIAVRDTAGAAASAVADVFVAPIPTSVTVAAPPGNLAANVAYPLTATIADQFGNPMTTPTLVWSLAASGPRGSIDANGKFAALQSGDFKITAAVPGGPSGSVTITVAPAGTLPPVLSDITRSVTQSAVVIQWTTNDPSDAQVEYGLDLSYGTLSPLNPALALTHTVALTGLVPGKTYHYRVHSKNAGGKEAVSADLTFTTEGSPGRRMGR